MTDPVERTLTRPSLLDDIESLASHLAGKSCSYAPAAERVLSAVRNPDGGLAAALLRQSLGVLESRLVTFVRAETERLVHGD
jgi:hypothetical protein